MGVLCSNVLTLHSNAFSKLQEHGMDKQSELAIVRRAYAKQVLATAGVKEPRLESAYAQVSREYFLGPGPWPIFRWWSGTYTQSPDDDPVYLYTNDVIGIDPERRINNGEPAFHANLIAAALPRQGEHVVHIGTGVGYYTAILAHLVGSSGRVTGIEFESDLAARARVNFSGAKFSASGGLGIPQEGYATGPDYPKGAGYEWVCQQ
jgi:protein-L-isoaspartate(D-aspartate) O-methyltransferase